ncbi:acylphosphatase [Microbulbifer agarilyticus]|uniref:acylphosphatase n=1 Tax=Microbulbifer agarilyticus TaxID=260552 RepID=UPI001C95DD8E|nr:acylphosphatase [Microbulbifer agarilyticus]MBY6211972.1 acylphosphatase [Microbulbifer agarilyticus]
MHDAIESSGATISDERSGLTAEENSVSVPSDRVQAPLPVEKVIQESGPNDFSASKFLQSQDDVGIQLLCNAAAALDLDVQYHGNLIFEVFDEHRRFVFRQNAPENSAVYAYCAREKHIAKQIMAMQGVPVPPGNLFRDYESALEFFKQSGVMVTVKPADGAAGHGVTSRISTESEFAKAWGVAINESREVIVEQHIFGEDIRILVVAGKAEAAYVRVPASVIGDGQNSIRELVAEKNAVRKRNPSLRIDPITRFDLLERCGLSLDYVPEDGETVQLTSVANASAGGETVQIFDYLDREVLEIAERAAKCFPGLLQVGVDLIYLSPEQWREGLPRGYIIEVNSNPAISDAVFPSYGRPIDVPDKLVSHMFSEAYTALSRSSLTGGIALAESYCYERYDRIFGKGSARQIALIKQAAYGLNLQVEQVADGLYRLVGENSSCLFHHGTPDRLRMISRKITRNSEWMASLMPSNTAVPPKDASTLKHYRLLVVGGKLVSALQIQSKPGRSGVVRREVGDLVHPSIQGVLQQTLASLFDPPLVGIDFDAEDLSSDLSSQPWKVKDAVCNPNLSWHHFPSAGAGRNVARALVASVFDDLNCSSVSKTCERFVIRGDVQGVGFRRWLKLIAILHSVSGWVRNYRVEGEPILEAVVEGTPAAINRLYTLCHRGPKSARVDAIDRSVQSCSGKSEFSVIG